MNPMGIGLVRKSKRGCHGPRVVYVSSMTWLRSDKVTILQQPGEGVLEFAAATARRAIAEGP